MRFTVKELKESENYKNINSIKSRLGKDALCVKINDETGDGKINISAAKCLTKSLDYIKRSTFFEHSAIQYKYSLSKTNLCSELSKELKVAPVSTCICAAPEVPFVRNVNTRQSVRIARVGEHNVAIDNKCRRRIIRRFGGKRALDIIPKNWLIIKHLGEGGSGDIYLIAHGSKRRVLKYQTETEIDTLYEIGMHIEFVNKNLALDLHATDMWFSKKACHSVYMMAMVDKMIADFLRKEIPEEQINVILKSLKYLIDQMCVESIQHNDFHWGNIGIVFDTTTDKLKLRPVILDFGYASVVKLRRCRKFSAYYQLIRTLGMSSGIHPKNMSKLFKTLIQLFNESLVNSRKTKAQDAYIKGALAWTELNNVSIGTMVNEFSRHFRWSRMIFRPAYRARYTFVNKHMNEIGRYHVSNLQHKELV
jgi:hypothetical protein